MDDYRLEVGKEMYFLIVDLKKGKDTRKILSDLNRGFPWPSNVIEKGKHEYFRVNKRIVIDAKENLSPDLEWTEKEGKKDKSIRFVLENTDPTDKKDWERQHKLLRDWIEINLKFPTGLTAMWIILNKPAKA